MNISVKPIILLLACFVWLPSCNDDTNPGPTSGQGGVPTNNSWLIPQEFVFDGGPGKDGIPSIDNPTFISVNEVDFLDDNDLIIGFREGDVVRGYPHPILDWHEIVNDEVGNTKIALTYCPLTGTASGWNRVINGTETTFGVSGLLYNTNLIPYDRNTDSNWSQMRLDCVQGTLRGTAVDLLPVIETSWSTWKKLYPTAEVLSTNTGFSRNYSRYPYGDYRTNDNNLIFPVTNEDGRLGRKERVLGVQVGTFTKAYHIASFNTTLGVEIRQEALGGEQIVVAGSSTDNLAVAFLSTLNGEQLSFEAGDLATGVLMTDQNGNAYDMFGRAISGPNQGQQLENVRSFIGFWFAWAAFFPNLSL